MTDLNPDSGIATGLPIDFKQLLDAEDLISEARDFGNMISLAFREPKDPDAVSVAVVANHLVELLRQSRALIRAFKDGVQNGR